MRQFVFPLGWTILIGVLTGLPGNSFPNMSLWALLSFDSFAHAFVFAVFTILWAVALCKQIRRPFMRRNGLSVALAAGIGYGMLIELLQAGLYEGRSAEWTDIIADILGCIIGVFIFKWIYYPELIKIKDEAASEDISH